MRDDRLDDQQRDRDGNERIAEVAQTLRRCNPACSKRILTAVSVRCVDAGPWKPLLNGKRKACYQPSRMSSSTLLRLESGGTRPRS